MPLHTPALLPWLMLAVSTGAHSRLPPLAVCLLCLELCQVPDATGDCKVQVRTAESAAFRSDCCHAGALRSHGRSKKFHFKAYHRQSTSGQQQRCLFKRGLKGVGLRRTSMIHLAPIRGAAFRSGLIHAPPRVLLGQVKKLLLYAGTVAGACSRARACVANEVRCNKRCNKQAVPQAVQTMMIDSSWTFRCFQPVAQIHFWNSTNKPTTTTTQQQSQSLLSCCTFTVHAPQV